jgi:hypothetical protein
MKTTATSSVLMTLFFSYLLISVGFAAPLNTATAGGFGSIISQLPIINQLFLASLLNLDAKADISAFNFSPSVAQAIGKATDASITANIAVGVSLLNVLNICVRLNALINANPAFGNIVTAHASVYASVLDNFFNAVGPVNVVAKAFLDVRSSPNFISALATAGVPNIPALINLGVIINIALVLNQLFQQVLSGLVPELAAVVSSVLPLVNNLLITISGLVNNILYTVIGLLGGITTTLVGVLEGIVFPTLAQVLGIVFPTVSQLLGGPLLGQLLPFGSLLPIPSQILSQAFPLWQLLNAVN